MGVTLIDTSDDNLVFTANFWNWRAIVEAVRLLDVLPSDRVDGLHELFVGDLTRDEARRVGDALRLRLIATLSDGERLLLDGSRTTEPDDGVFHRTIEDWHRNYGTSRDALERFAAFCEETQGFKVL